MLPRNDFAMSTPQRKNVTVYSTRQNPLCCSIFPADPNPLFLNKIILNAHFLLIRPILNKMYSFGYCKQQKCNLGQIKLIISFSLARAFQIGPALNFFFNFYYINLDRVNRGLRNALNQASLALLVQKLF